MLPYGNLLFYQRPHFQLIGGSEGQVYFFSILLEGLVAERTYWGCSEVGLGRTQFTVPRQLFPARSPTLPPISNLNLHRVPTNKLTGFKSLLTYF
jgi:hypothetical protein